MDDILCVLVVRFYRSLSARGRLFVIVIVSEFASMFKWLRVRIECNSAVSLQQVCPIIMHSRCEF